MGEDRKRTLNLRIFLGHIFYFKKSWIFESQSLSLNEGVSKYIEQIRPGEYIFKRNKEGKRNETLLKKFEKKIWFYLFLF